MVQSRFVTACVCAAACAGVAFGAPDASRTGADNAVRPAATTLSAEQRAALSAELARYLRQDADGLVARTTAGGGLALDLDGRYQHTMIVRPMDDGARELACFDDADSAVAFLSKDDLRAAAASTEDSTRTPRSEERDR